jgi:hypothetical protein
MYTALKTLFIPLPFPRGWAALGGSIPQTSLLRSDNSSCLHRPSMSPSSDIVSVCESVFQDKRERKIKQMKTVSRAGVCISARKLVSAHVPAARDRRPCIQTDPQKLGETQLYENDVRRT